MSELPPEDDGFDDVNDSEPLLYQDYFAAFEDLIGTTGRAGTYSGGEAAGAFAWIEMFEETGISTGSRETDVEAFEEFLIAFYPQNKTPEEWYYDREEFYETYDISDADIDWEAYREAIDSP